MDQQAESFAKAIVKDDRLTMQERALLLYVLHSDHPFTINPTKLAVDTKFGDRSFNAAMRKFYNLSIISPRYRMGLGFALVAYRLTYTAYQQSKSVQGNKYYQRKVKLFQRDESWRPKKINYGQVEIKYYDDVVPDVNDDDNEEIIVPEVINGVAVTDYVENILD
jgi:hypothetical protein